MEDCGVTQVLWIGQHPSVVGIFENIKAGIKWKETTASTIMPLESLPDRFGDAHAELDKAVNEDTLAWNNIPNPFILPFSEHLLLSYIVLHSKGELDPKYRYLEEYVKLIEARKELRDMLVSAWESKSYRDIRNLAILKNPASVMQPSVSITSDMEPEMVYLGLSKSFEAKYHGAAIEGFHEYLTENESLFKEKEGPAYYARFCSIVQSSGTGKSRLLTELYKKDIVVLYMNLRKETDVRSFPARDSIPADILTKFPPTQAAYQLICYAFFIALFDTLDERLRDTKENVMEWARQMCDVGHVPKHTTRSNFFSNVLEKYKKIHAELVLLPTRSPNAETNLSSSDVDKAADAVEELSLSDTPFSLFSPVYHSVGAGLKRIFPGGADRPRVVIAFDEAHPLTPTKTNDVGGYRPADVLCRIISKYSHTADYPIWVVFASTTSKVADFAPPNEKHNSERVASGGQQLFPPYTQLGWDQNAKALGDIDIEEVSKLGHIASYGRPLWRSLMTALNVPSEVLMTASSKLCGSGRFDPKNIDHVLAVLGQRFAVDITFGHPDSVAFLETAVASHLRICIGTTLDRRWRWTNYPSEPLLSCVAASNLHEDPNNLQRALDVLLDAVNRGMVDMGRRGELASRLLWLLAKDLYVRASAPEQRTTKPKSWNENIPDCEMIPVVDWLEFIFGSQVWDKENLQALHAREKLKNAYLNFSHWVEMDANLTSKDGNELDLDELTLRHWQRTSAVQCYHLQPLIDKVIPIYFKGESRTASAKGRMSQIFISDKARRSMSSKALLSKITRRSEHLSRPDEGTKHDVDSHPYIAILADLGQEPSFSETFPVRDVQDRCLRIYAAGVNTTTYPFLADHPKLMDVLQTLVRLQQMPETKKPYTEYLNAQVKFGSTATAQHMHWEHGKTVPNLQASVQSGNEGSESDAL